MNQIYRQLEWLEAPPAPWPAVQIDPVRELATLRGLARSRLAYHELDRVAARLSALPSAAKAELPVLRLAVVSDANHAFFRGAFVATALRHGFVLQLRTSTLADALRNDDWAPGELPDVVLIALDLRQLHDARQLASPPAEARAWLNEQREWFRQLVSTVEQRAPSLLLLQNFVTPPDQLDLGDERDGVASAAALCRTLNEVVRESVSRGAWAVDLQALTRSVGAEAWYSPTLWDMAKCPLSMEAAPLYADFVFKQVAAAQGRAAKCLVLDLDNTLWGGVLADEGPESIRVRQGDPVGEAFLRFQQAVLHLHQQGVVLAICSKNDLAPVLEVFERNPAMVLRREHFSAIRANWQDKATNIVELSEELGLGLDSMVFFDDNPAERQWVRGQLPMVHVVEVPRDPAHYAWTLLAARYFNFDRRTQEDGLRTADYQAAIQRRSLKESLGTQDEFIQSLGIKLHIARIGSADLQRSVQLLNKTNQFNFNKRVVTEAELRRGLDDAATLAWCVRLEDRFGDQGLISVVLAESREGLLCVTDWVMSCRVIGRTVEHSVLATLVRHGRSLGLGALALRVCPTPRNGMVQAFLQDLGFGEPLQTEGPVLTYHRPLSALEVTEKISDVRNDL